MRRSFPDGNITLIGKRMPGVDPSFGNQIGFVPYEEVPIYMNRAKNFVFLPRWPEPQGRVVVEAAMCGCNLVVNGNVGALSFDFDLRDPRNYEGAAADFWGTLEQVAGR